MNNEKNPNIKENIFVSHSIDETFRLGKKLSRFLSAGDIIALNGGLGAGKTSFVKGIALGLNSIDHVTSPSFTLINEYEGDLKIYHFDLYRLTCLEELEDLGYEEYLFSKDGITLVEWADKIKGFSPTEKLIIEINILEQFQWRSFEFIPDGIRYMEIYRKLKRECIF